MKIKKLLMLLSVLLCVAIFFAACADENGNEEPKNVKDEVNADVDGEEITESVEAKLENFFEIEAIGEKVWGEATRYDGEFLQRSGTVFAMKKADVDASNTVTETFTIYNTTVSEPVLEVTNQYKNGDYSTFNWSSPYVYEEEYKYPESIMKIFLRDYYGAVIVEVATAKLTPLEVDEDVNPDGNYYEVKFEYSYYDAFGTLITKTDRRVSDNSTENSATKQVRLTVGSVVAYLDMESGKLIKTVGADNQVLFNCYDAQTYKYGYYLGQSVEGAFGFETEFFEVFDRQSGELVLRYNLECADRADAFVLRNGNVLIQYINSVDNDSELPYDFYIEGYGAKCTIEQYVVDVKTGKATEVEPGYIVGWLVPNTELMSQTAKLKDEGITLTRNTVNLAEITPIKNGRVDGASNIAVLNNDLTVMFELERVVPEHRITNNGPYTDLGFEKLVSGDYLVTLDDVISDRAIVSADGKLRSYLNSTDMIVGNYIVTSTGIYDYDKKLVKTIEGSEYTVYGAVGSMLIVSKQIETTPDYGIDNLVPTIERQYFAVDLSSSAMTETPILDADDNVTVVQIYNNNLLMVLNRTTKRYIFYNVNMEHVLTVYAGNNLEYTPSVSDMDDMYVIGSTLAGDYVCYTIK